MNQNLTVGQKVCATGFFLGMSSAIGATSSTILGWGAAAGAAVVPAGTIAGFVTLSLVAPSVYWLGRKLGVSDQNASKLGCVVGAIAAVAAQIFTVMKVAALVGASMSISSVIIMNLTSIGLILGAVLLFRLAAKVAESCCCRPRREEEQDVRGGRGPAPAAPGAAALEVNSAAGAATQAPENPNPYERERSAEEGLAALEAADSAERFRRTLAMLKSHHESAQSWHRREQEPRAVGGGAAVELLGDEDEDPFGTSASQPVQPQPAVDPSASPADAILQGAPTEDPFADSSATAALTAPVDVDEAHAALTNAELLKN